MARFLGLDIGSRRIGVALSDPTGLIASPLKTIHVARKPEEAIGELIALAEEEEVEGYVVGLPLHMSGKQGAMAQKIRAFAKELTEKSQKPVLLWDERLSSAAAERALLSAGMRRAARREVRDAVAAALILQGWLDARRTHPSPEEIP